MASIALPNPLFPYAIDGYESLLLVHNRSETVLSKKLLPGDQRIDVGVDFSRPERFSRFGGYAQIVGIDGVEDIYYSRGEWSYAPSNDLVAVDQGLYVSTTEMLDLEYPIIPNGLDPTVGAGKNAVIVRGEKYSLSGVIKVSGVSVDFAVQGDGAQGKGAQFFFSRPDLFQTELSEIDVDAGLLTLFPLGFGYEVISMFGQKAVTEDDGQILRRVGALVGLIRGMRGTHVCTHDAGSFVRSYIMAEHHTLLARALVEVQTLMGVDLSEDTESIDYRLRDLTDLCVEGDDFICPDVTFEYRLVDAENDSDCVVLDTYQFDLSVQGDISQFGIFFGDGTVETDNLSPVKQYPPNSRVEPSAYVDNERCRVATAFFEDQAETIEDIPEIPNLICPDVGIPDIPTSPDVSIPEFPDIPFLNIEIPSFTIPDFSIFISVPTAISFNPTFPEISITFPNFNFTLNIPDFNNIIEVTYNFSVNLPPQAGPCFALVPCGGYCHGS